MSLKGKVLFITGASRGIGLAIALRAARDGARIVIAAKTAEPHKHLPGTIFSAAEEVRLAGGEALPLVLDVRSEGSIEQAVSKAVATFGGIDVCINNASAISPTPTLETTSKKFDLMHQVNARGTFLVSQACIPHLLCADNPHILNLSPPLNLDPRWLGAHIAYTLSKYGMSLCALGMAAEYREAGIAVNGLWPISTIDTSAIRFVLGGEAMASCSRSPQIMADAAYALITTDARSLTGELLLDEIFLRSRGQTDFSQYQTGQENADLHPDMYVSEDAMLKTPTRFLPEAAWPSRRH